MSDNKCPLCGNSALDGEDFCRDCQEIANNSLSEQLLAHEVVHEAVAEVKIEEIGEEVISVNELSPTTEQSEEEVVNKDVLPKTKSLFRKPAVLISILLAVLLLGAGGYFYWQKKQSEAIESALWDKCIEENTPIAYARYLKQYPDGKFEVQAHEKIVALREEETKEWQKLRGKADVNLYSAFLVDHPDSPHADAVKTAIDSLSWANAITENTAAAYQVYLSNADLGLFPGEYRALAQEKYDYLSQLRTLEDAEVEELYKKLNEYFELLAKNSYNKLGSMMAPTLVNFFGVENKPQEVIVKSIEADIKERKIKSIQYAITNKQLVEVIQDNKGVYFFDLQLTREISYKDRKKKKEQIPLSVKIELNKEKLIQYINDKEKVVGKN